MRDPGFSLLVLASIFHWDFGFRVDTVPLLAYPRTIFVLPLHTLILKDIAIGSQSWLVLLPFSQPLCRNLSHKATKTSMFTKYTMRLLHTSLLHVTRSGSSHRLDDLLLKIIM